MNIPFGTSPRHFIKRPQVVRGLAKRVIGVGRLERTLVCTFCAQMVGANADDGSYAGAVRRAGGKYNAMATSSAAERRQRELRLMTDDHAPEAVIDAWAASLVAGTLVE